MIPGSIPCQECRWEEKWNINTQFNKAFYLTYAGVDISATFSGAVLLSMCYRYIHSACKIWMATQATHDMVLGA